MGWGSSLGRDGHDERQTLLRLRLGVDVGRFFCAIRTFSFLLGNLTLSALLRRSHIRVLASWAAVRPWCYVVSNFKFARQTMYFPGPFITQTLLVATIHLSRHY